MDEEPIRLADHSSKLSSGMLNPPPCDIELIRLTDSAVSDVPSATCEHCICRAVYRRMTLTRVVIADWTAVGVGRAAIYARKLVKGSEDKSVVECSNGSPVTMPQI